MNWDIINLDNGLAPVQRQAIIKINDFYSTLHQGTNFSQI